MRKTSMMKLNQYVLTMGACAGMCMLGTSVGCQKASRLDVNLIEPCDQQNQSMQGIQTIQSNYFTPDPESGFPKETEDSAARETASTIENGVTPLQFDLDEEVFLEFKGFEQAAEEGQDTSFLNAAPYSIARSVPLVKQAQLLENEFIGESAQITIPMGRLDSFGQASAKSESGGSECSYLTSGEAIEGRHGHTATYIPAIHKVFIAGGAVWQEDPTASLDLPQCKEFVRETGETSISCLTFLQSAELFDPNTGAFIELPPLPNRRGYHSATLLSDDRTVLVMGGFTPIDGRMDALINGFVFDPDLLPSDYETSGAESDASPYTSIRFNAQRANHTATLIPESKVVVIVGGCTGEGCTPFGAASDASAETPDSTQRFSAPIEIYEEETGSIYPAEGLSDNETGAFERAFHTTAYTGEYLLVSGGVTGDGTSCNMELLRVNGASVELVQTYTTDVCTVGHTATVLDGGRKIFMIGGVTEAPGGVPSTTATPVSNVQVWTAQEVESQAINLTTGRTNHSAVLLADDSVLVVGGRVENTITAERVVLSDLTQSYIPAPITLPMVQARISLTATMLPNKHVFVAGGYAETGETSPRAEIYFAE